MHSRLIALSVCLESLGVVVILTPVVRLCKYGGQTFQFKNLEFPMAALLLERSPGTGEHQVCCLRDLSNVICDNL